MSKRKPIQDSGSDSNSGDEETPVKGNTKKQKDSGSDESDGSDSSDDEKRNKKSAKKSIKEVEKAKSDSSSSESDEESPPSRPLNKSSGSKVKKGSFQRSKEDSSSSEGDKKKKDSSIPTKKFLGTIAERRSELHKEGSSSSKEGSPENKIHKAGTNISKNEKDIEDKKEKDEPITVPLNPKNKSVRKKDGKPEHAVSLNTKPSTDKEDEDNRSAPTVPLNQRAYINRLSKVGFKSPFTELCVGEIEPQKSKVNPLINSLKEYAGRRHIKVGENNIVYSVVGAILFSALERIFSVKTGGKIQEDFINCFGSKDGVLFKEGIKQSFSCEGAKLNEIKDYFKNKKGDAKEILKLVFCEVRVGM